MSRPSLAISSAFPWASCNHTISRRDKSCRRAETFPLDVFGSPCRSARAVQITNLREVGLWDTYLSPPSWLATIGARAEGFDNCWDVDARPLTKGLVPNDGDFACGIVMVKLGDVAPLNGDRVVLLKREEGELGILLGQDGRQNSRGSLQGHCAPELAFAEKENCF